VKHLAIELDALSVILPIDRRDQLALLLTDNETATPKHLAENSMGESTLRAPTSDLDYLEARAQAATGEPPALIAPASADPEIHRATSVGPGRR
jgi:hypothetical protein